MGVWGQAVMMERAVVPVGEIGRIDRHQVVSRRVLLRISGAGAGVGGSVPWVGQVQVRVVGVV